MEATRDYLESLVTTGEERGNRESTFRDRIKVTPQNDNKKMYPDNAIIISMGPEGIGKTKYLEQTFSKDSIISISSESEEINNKNLESLEQILKNNEKQKIVIDGHNISQQIRQKIYSLAKKNSRQVYFLLSTIGKEEITSRINKCQHHNTEKSRNSIKKMQKIVNGFENKLPENSEIYEAELRENGLLNDELSNYVTTIVHGMRKKEELER